MPERLICNKIEIASKISSLKEAGSRRDGTADYYIDPITNEPWVLTSFESDYLGLEVEVLMKAEIEFEELINISLTSEDLKIVSAASKQLLYKEKEDQIQFRETLIEKLEQVNLLTLSSLEKERIRTIIYDSQLHDGRNQKSIMRKDWSEILKDTEQYQGPAKRAMRMLEVLNSQSGQDSILRGAN